uniref:Reverse transcriptase zinc-binding domain-containing protein n=1 Tax=Aegilops tauschii subsp. strangulata TaxID=200361 RepID=A0A453T4E1_AEGTS
VIRLIRDFLWHGNKDAHAGCCIVSWQKVCRPLALGGLGIRDLHRTGVALRTRWLWLQRT